MQLSFQFILFTDNFAVLAVTVVSDLSQERKMLQCDSSNKCMKSQMSFICPDKIITET